MTAADLYLGVAVSLGLLAGVCGMIASGCVTHPDPYQQHPRLAVALLVVASLLGGAAVACAGASHPDDHCVLR
jgi:hypothetical protein